MSYLAVAIGGCLGACARYGISLAFGFSHWATFFINLSGSFFLTWFYTVTLERRHIHPHLRLGIGTGFVGAFTTFSTFTVDAWKLFARGDSDGAFLYVAASVACGLVGAWLGYHMAMRQSALRFVEDIAKEP